MKNKRQENLSGIFICRKIDFFKNNCILSKQINFNGG